MIFYPKRLKIIHTYWCTQTQVTIKCYSTDINKLTLHVRVYQLSHLFIDRNAKIHQQALYSVLQEVIDAEKGRLERADVQEEEMSHYQSTESKIKEANQEGGRHTKNYVQARKYILIAQWNLPEMQCSYSTVTFK